MGELSTKRRRKKAFLRNVAFAVSVAETGDVELTLFAGRREVTRTLKAGEAQLLAHLLSQTWPQLGDCRCAGRRGGWLVDPEKEKAAAILRYQLGLMSPHQTTCECGQGQSADLPGLPLPAEHLPTSPDVSNLHPEIHPCQRCTRPEPAPVEPSHQSAHGGSECSR